MMIFDTPLELKAEPSILLRETGSKIDFNDEHPENACDSIRRRCEFDSN
jgi:hypothetical protein